MKRRRMSLWPIVAVVVVVCVPPVVMLSYQSARTGMSWSQIVQRLMSRAASPSTGLEGISSTVPGPRVDFLVPQPIGDPFEKPPRISYLEAVDLDQDGLLDVVVCDVEGHRVTWIRQHPRDVFLEHTCADRLNAPAHVQAIDFDRDGDLDLLVAVLGILFPSNDKIGSVVILENTGAMKFRRHVVIDGVARVSDVRGGDFDNDGDLDLAVAQFGYDDGETRWLENLGDWRFQSHILQTLSGPIHAEIADVDRDGDLDIVSLVSQEWEEIYIFLNDGSGEFTPRLIYGSANDDFGSSGMSLSDFDQDGDLDILYTNGDSFDYLPPRPRPWHGVQWLENEGNLNFRFRRIADYPGAFSSRAVDIDDDGDLELFVVSAFSAWEKVESQSFSCLENAGDMSFRQRDITSTPTHVLALDSGDFDGDGQVDFVTGGMHVYPPFDRMSRVLLWRNRRLTSTQKE